jgi:ubiquinone/menaquinone biosynthesis C-methylase UbiE
MRKPFQGIWNIVRFNWHYFVLASSLVVLLVFIQCYFSSLSLITNIIALLIVCSTLISLAVSAYIYDISDLYKFSWLTQLKKGENDRVINIHAGFDETSNLLKCKFAISEIFVADFYDPTKHTEVSIKRARKAYPPFPNTQQVSTTHLPIQDNVADMIFIILSAHEIRSEDERITFFKELHRVLKPCGQVIVTEHLRDTANFFAYNIGFFHFHSKATWLKAFHLAGLTISKEIKTTPFITTFILEKNGTAS